jgi:hypothetical protein
VKLPKTAQLEGSFQRWCWLYAKAYYRASAGLPSGMPGESGAMAQQVAHLLCKQGVRGSSPLGSTIKAPSQTPVLQPMGTGGRSSAWV